MNLFSSNFNSVKAVINEADVNEKTSKNSYKKLISNIKQKETKNIIKLAGIGVSLISAIYFVIKRYNKYKKDILSEENIQQENEARLKEIQQKDNTRRKKEVQLKKNSKQWFETLETQYETIVIPKKRNLNSDKEIKKIVNFCFKAIELERQYLEIFSMGLNLENYSFLDRKVTVINTGATLNFNHDNSDPLIDCDDDHKTAEKVLGDLKETFSAFSIISNFLRIIRMNYFYKVRDVSDTNSFIGFDQFFSIQGFKIINDEFVDYHHYYYFNPGKKVGLNVRIRQHFECIFMSAYEKERILEFLNTLEKNLKNPFNVQKGNILKLFTFY